MEHHLLEIVGLVAIVVAVSAAAKRFGLLTPIVLVIAGLALSVVPGFPEIHLESEFVLIGVLPPLLYVAALETSVPAFRFNLRPILLLAIGLVLFTAFSVGFVAHALLPGVPFSICLALGAVVAPPDAVSATAVARRIGLPRRMVTILEGESLINDATALVLLRLAALAAAGGSVGPANIAWNSLLAAGGGILFGVLGALVFGFLHKRTSDPLIDNALSLITPFVVVIAAETVHASGVVAVVVTGLALGHRWPTLMSAASRLQMGAFWRLVNFMLEGLVFLLVGLQLRQIMDGLETSTGTVAAVTGAVFATVIIARFVWLYPVTYLVRLVPRIRERDPRPPIQVPTVLAWAGMRGVVTLGAALTLPDTLADGREYPRDLFLFIAFATIVGTLLLQGMTLQPLVRRLKLQPDDPQADVLAEAAIQNRASRAARDRLDEQAGDAPETVVKRLEKLTQQRNNVAWERLGAAGTETPSRAYVRLRREMIDAEREVFRKARDEGRITEEVLRRAQHEMDLEESMLERKLETS
ncbi:Na+/H+ antiporter [Virgisporangium ochraceum]|uniref:Na+/H+ antiporter n=1 Tax=Virgisporangium ochraceum TaxID=65505 RepID=A0A8J4EBP7_9ACTN|nr:Na+/H+ antiporter [Virgisporangium ochraceum]GIJ66057.1 Na+/H+ antiporter [Virgisporangium ochraceum]